MLENSPQESTVQNTRTGDIDGVVVALPYEFVADSSCEALVMLLKMRQALWYKG